MKRFSLCVLTVVMVGVLVVGGCKSRDESRDKNREVSLNYEKEGSEFTGEVVGKNLRKKSEYVLCLNGKIGQDGNVILKKWGDWGGEGYYDFERIKSDDHGDFASKFSVELPAGKYDITFLVKDVLDNYKPIFIRDHVRFRVRK